MSVSVSRAELRWATACCSAVTMPALMCIIYPPADWSRERHNHSNQSCAYIHTHCNENHWLYWHGRDLCWLNLRSHMFWRIFRILVLKKARNEELLKLHKSCIFSCRRHPGYPLTRSKQTENIFSFFFFPFSKVGHSLLADIHGYILQPFLYL